MPNVTTVGITAGVPTSGTGTVSTLDNLVGAAGTPSTNVQSVQGITGGTAVKVDGSAVTQPVSGTFWQATQPVSVATIPTHAVTQSGTWNTRLQDGAGNAVTSDLRGTKQAIAVEIVDGSGNQVTSFGGSGGTASNYGSAFPTTGTAIGGSDGTNMVAMRVKTTAPSGSDPALVVALSPNGLNANGQTTMSNSAPMAIASDQTVTVKATTTTSGLTRTRIVAAASTNATNLKASAGKVFNLRIFNVATYDVFFKFYDKASAPTVGTDTPIWTIPLKAGTGYSEHFPMGFDFTTGVSYAITKLQPDSDTTVLVASDVTGTIGWV